jgi:hypothetical protein
MPCPCLGTTGQLRVALSAQRLSTVCLPLLCMHALTVLAGIHVVPAQVGAQRAEAGGAAERMRVSLLLLLLLAHVLLLLLMLFGRLLLLGHHRLALALGLGLALLRWLGDDLLGLRLLGASLSLALALALLWDDKLGLGLGLRLWVDKLRLALHLRVDELARLPLNLRVDGWTRLPLRLPLRLQLGVQKLALLHLLRHPLRLECAWLDQLRLAAHHAALLRLST